MTQVLCISYHGELQLEVQPLVDLLPPPYFVEPVPDVGVAGPSLDRGNPGGASSKRASPMSGTADSIGDRVQRRRLASQKSIAASSSGVIHLSDEEIDVGASERSPAVHDLKAKGRANQGSSATPCPVSPQVSEFVTLVERLCAASFAAGEAIGRRDGPEESVEFGPLDDPQTVMNLLLHFERV